MRRCIRAAIQSELLTPTGALILTEYATAFGPMPPMRVERVGYGAGDRDCTDTPNVVRVLVGEAARPQAQAPGPKRVVVLECEIDDMNPQIFGVLMDRLLRGRRAGRVLHRRADEEEPPGHADDGRRAAGAARAR